MASERYGPTITVKSLFCERCVGKQLKNSNDEKVENKKEESTSAHLNGGPRNPIVSRISQVW